MEKVLFFYNVSKWKCYERRFTFLFRCRKSLSEWLSRVRLPFSSLIFFIWFSQHLYRYFLQRCHISPDSLIYWWHQKQKTWNLNKGYGTWVDSTLLVFKRREVSHSKRWVNNSVKKSKSLEKTYIKKGDVFKFSFGLHCFDISVIFFTMLLSTCCVFVFVQFVSSIRVSSMDFPLECEFKQTLLILINFTTFYISLFIPQFLDCTKIRVQKLFKRHNKWYLRSGKSFQITSKL